MRSPLFAFLFLISAAYSPAAESRPNVLFIAIDDLRNDLGALGAEHARTPQLDAFAKTARLFSHHYVQVPTCGASRCALLSGLYPRKPVHLSNNGIKATNGDWGTKSLPAVFRKEGYRTLALGKISHHPGGLTGKNWAEGPEELPGAWDRSWIPEGPWANPLAIMHGYANGAARQVGKSPALEAHDGTDESYPDAWVAKEAVKTLKELAANKQPWWFGVGFFKPHLPFAAPKKWHNLHANGVPSLPLDAIRRPTWPSSWHNSGEFFNNYSHAPGDNPSNNAEYAQRMRSAYAACISYMDAQVGQVLTALQDLGLAENTIVVIWSDHGFLLGEHAIWGKHCLFEHALRSPLMIRHPGLAAPGHTSSATVETVDLFPTLVDLCGMKAPDGLDGQSLRPQLLDPAAPSKKPAAGFWTSGKRTIRTDRWRLIVHSQGKGKTHTELFDYQTDPYETRNLSADHPAVVDNLMVEIERLPNPIGKEDEKAQ